MLNFKSVLGVLAAAVVTTPCSSSAVAADENAIVIHASGFRNARGHAIAKMFLPGDNVLSHGRWQATAEIQGGQVSFRFRGLPAGAYAAVVFHDQNDNGEIDHNTLKLPNEALGFSNGFTLGLRSGLPTFDRLRFQHAVGLQRLDISVK